MLKIRLQRIGRKNDPAFRVVVIDSHRGPKAGKYLEMLGSYRPHNDFVQLKGERILHWIKQGAQVSDTMHNLLITHGVREGKKINKLPRKSPILKEGEKKEVVVDAPEVAVSETSPIEAKAQALAEETPPVA